MLGAGIGAGLGAFFAWLRLDRNPLPITSVTLLLALLLGIAGGWAGYQYGANAVLELECCAEPETAPFTYTAFGAMLAANAVVAFLGIGREIMPRIGWLMSQGRSKVRSY